MYREKQRIAMIRMMNREQKQESRSTYLRGPFEKYMNWRQCAAVMQREAMTVMPNCSSGGNVILA
jgi:hypothetical protein